jgi:hypothetical protein
LGDDGDERVKVKVEMNKTSVHLEQEARAKGKGRKGTEFGWRSSYTYLLLMGRGGRDGKREQTKYAHFGCSRIFLLKLNADWAK